MKKANHKKELKNKMSEEKNPNYRLKIQVETIKGEEAGRRTSREYQSLFEATAVFDRLHKVLEDKERR